MTEVPTPPRPLARSSEGRILTGVCAGLGRYTGIDPIVFRAGFALLLLGSGVGVYLYLAAFLLMRAPTGGPGYVEQWTRRDFSGDTVLALLTAVLGFGLMINLATVAFGMGTLVVAILLAVGLLAAHSNGVDLLGLARSMPERLNRRRPRNAPAPVPSAPPPSFDEVPLFGGGTAKETARDEPDFAVPRPAPAAPPRWSPAEEHVEALSEDVRPEEPARDTSADGPTTDGPTATFPSASTTPTYQTATPRLSYGEPFAPHGPYQPLDPTRRPGYYDPRNFAPQAPERRPKRAKSVIGVLTTLLALIIGVIVVAVQTSPSGTGSPSLVVVSGAMLVTIGAGLLVATWWGRGAGLVALGTVIALAAAVGLMFSGLPKKITDAVWTPRSMQDVPQTYSVGIGEGTLDLTELPLQAGSTTTFNASISVGELTVIVPPTARVEVHATNRVGDIKIDHQVNGGTSLEINETLEPEVEPGTGEPATIVLRIKGGVGDMEVRRAA